MLKPKPIWPLFGKRLRAGLAIAIIWGAIALFEAWQYYFTNTDSLHPIPFFVVLRTSFFFFSFWAAATPVILWMAHKVRIGGRAGHRNLWVHAGMWVTLSFIHALYRVPLHNLSYPGSDNSGFRRLLFYYFFGNAVSTLLIYGMLVAIIHAWNYLHEYQTRELKGAQLESRLAEAQLQALKMQIQPHFLFNTLNAITALMREDVTAAENMMTHLSDLLRRTLEMSEAQEVTVKDELDSLAPYLSIQQTRFQDRLSFDVSVD